MGINLIKSLLHEYYSDFSDFYCWISTTIHGTADEGFSFAEIEIKANELIKKNPRTKLIRIENTSHYDTGKFIIPLKYSYKWLSELDLQ